MLLSGGLDSSLVAAIAARKIKREDSVWGKLHSFCVGLPSSPDLKAARKVADFLGTDHHEFHFTVQVRGRERERGRAGGGTLRIGRAMGNRVGGQAGPSACGQWS